MRRRASRGFTLIELTIVVAIVGVLAAVAVPVFTRQVRRSRTVEAANDLERMWAGSIVYFATDRTNEFGSPLPRQFPATVANVPGPECGCQAGGRCPGGGPEWQHATWVGLSFSIPDPFLYKPRYTSAGTGSAATFTAEAVGDVDCNGLLSDFKRTGAIDANGAVIGLRAPIVTDELE